MTRQDKRRQGNARLDKTTKNTTRHDKKDNTSAGNGRQKP